MSRQPEEALEYVADYFRALSAPSRLQILAALREEERSVGELASLCDCSSANVSRHLSILLAHGLVARTARGTSAYYRIADPSVHDLCELVCGNIARHIEQRAGMCDAFRPVAAKIFKQQGE